MKARPRSGKPPGSRHASAGAEAPGLGERRAAARAVAAALAREATLDDALSGHAGQPLVRAIAVTTFRHLGTILDVLAERMTRGVPKEPETVAILATGAAQILFLDVADHAAVDLAVRLSHDSRRTQHLSGMINAVLRRIAREREEILPPLSPISELPDWLAERWRAVYGSDRIVAIAAAQAAGAALDLTPRTEPSAFAERVDGVLLPTGSVRILDRRSVAEIPGFAEGEFWVQDAAAALPARLLEPRAGERIADLCAAPGGKTAQLAAAGAEVIAVDRSEDRLERLRANLRRLKLRAEIACTDVLSFEAEPFDAVLLDAPCSATGTIRRHPDIPWTKSEADILSLSDLQARLLDHAAHLVRPGGRLVYCVCSLESEEGEQQIRAFLARRPDFSRRPIVAGEHGLAADMLNAEGDLRTTPDLWRDAPGTPSESWRSGLDGFYATRLVRNPVTLSTGRDSL